MTEKEFLEEFGPNGRELWIVPMSKNIDMFNIHSGLCKPLGVFKTHITGVKENRNRYPYRDLEIDKSNYIHLRNMPEDTPEECKVADYQWYDHANCDLDDDILIIEDSLKEYNIFLSEKEANKFYKKQLKSFEKRFPYYIKKLKTEIYKTEEEINKLVKRQEYIELTIEDYRERYGEEYINSIIHAQESGNTISNIIKT